MVALEVCLATLYCLIAVERTDGMFGVFYRLRKYQSLPFHCATCLAPYAALVSLLLALYAPPILHILAVSGIAATVYLLLERYLLK